MSYIEDMGLDAYDVPEWVMNEEHWKYGMHFDKEDRLHKIKQISDTYLLNIINYFKGWDLTPLLKEAKRRRLLVKQ